MILLLTISTILLVAAYLDKKLTLRQFLRFAISSLISITVLILLMLLLTGLGQGLTLIVKLFFHWDQMFLTLLLINFLALILSHFPYYFELAIEGRKITWKKYPRRSALGYVFHEDSSGAEPFSVRYIRRHLGVLCYVIWIYILFFTDQNIFTGNYNPQLATGLIWLFLAVVQFLGEKYKLKVNYWISGDSGEEAGRASKRVKYFLRTFEGILYLNIISTVLFLINIAVNKWCQFNLRFLIALTLLNSLCYIIFRIVRPWFVYYKPVSWFNRPYFFERNPNIAKLSSGPVSYLVWLANHVGYLVAMSFFGIFTALIILYINAGYNDLNSIHINPVPLLITFVILYYSILVIALKHFIYNRFIIKNRWGQEWAEIRKTSLRVNQSLLAAVIFALIFVIAAHSVNNRLHTLFPIDNSQVQLVDKEAFCSAIDSTSTHYFIIGSYGGGLKAHLWNLLLLTEILENNPEFYRRVLCISGVSGGAMGIHSFINLLDREALRVNNSFAGTIDTIGNSNSLSIDINGLLFADFLREPLPDFFLSEDPPDRAERSMLFFQRLIHGGHGNIQDYRSSGTDMYSYWSHIFQSRGYFPAIIFNTTPTTARYGVACSVRGMDSFPVAIDILDHPRHKSLSFTDAASTTNRFPLFSPAAKIPGKGFFVDGGYFENSGLMNALSFFRQIKGRCGLSQKKVYAVNIVNDKSLYILEKFGDKIKSNYSDRPSGEIISILKGIIALERMPNYIRSEIEHHTDNVELITIQMPYLIDLKDIKKVFNTKEIDNEEYIIGLIVKNNNLVIDALKAHRLYSYPGWGVVTPPLGRLLSVPAREYQKAMILYHEELRAQLGRINGLSMQSRPIDIRNNERGEN